MVHLAESAAVSFIKSNVNLDAVAADMLASTASNEIENCPNAASVVEPVTHETGFELV